ncbi:MAG: phage portal protein [Dehalococcoidia bacterium]|nr:phage portal protein [Dehalococcoidia bacterium]
MTDFVPSTLAGLDRARMRTYAEMLDFYNGNHWTAGGRERRLVFNYARVNIDKVTSYLMTGFNWACDPVIDTPENRRLARQAEIAIRQVYDDNDCRSLDFETEVDTAVLGDGCYKVIWDTGEKRVRITSPDVTGLYAWRLSDDPAQIWRVATRYQLDADQIRELYGREVSGARAWITELWTASEFTLYLDDAVMAHRRNPYGFIPFVIFPNLRQPKEPWGVSDIPPLIEVQRELNRAMSQLSRILELSGNPIAVLENVEESSGIQVQPGAVWHMPPESRAYLLDLLKGGGARLHIEYIELLYRCMHDLAEAPRAAYGGIDRELSGVALEVELHSLLQKVMRKRAIRSAAYRRRNEMVLALLKKYAGQDYGQLRHRIVWGPVVPQDRARLAQNEQLLVVSGIHSRKRAMDEIGVEDPEAEFAEWLKEREQILRMNQETRARFGRGGPRERAEGIGRPPEADDES